MSHQAPRDSVAQGRVEDGSRFLFRSFPLRLQPQPYYAAGESGRRVATVDALRRRPALRPPTIPNSHGRRYGAQRKRYRFLWSRKVECGPFERLRYPILPRVRNGLALLRSTGLSSTARAPILAPLIHAQKRAHLVGGRLNPATQFAYSASSGMKTYQPLHSPVGCCCVRHDRSGTFPVQVVAGKGYC